MNFCHFLNVLTISPMFPNLRDKEIKGRADLKEKKFSYLNWKRYSIEIAGSGCVSNMNSVTIPKDAPAPRRAFKLIVTELDSQSHYSMVEDVPKRGLRVAFHLL
jgi:hypothetical protein